jgi:hypothetical protein
MRIEKNSNFVVPRRAGATAVLRRLAGSRVALAAAWIGGCATLEWLGARTTSDAGDVVSVCLLALLAAFTAGAHRVRPIASFRGAARALGRRLRLHERFGLDLGLDLRGEPRLPMRLPRVLIAWVVAPAVALLAASALGSRPPLLLRDGLAPISYSLYVVTLALVWSALVATLLASISFLYLILVRLASPPAREGRRAARLHGSVTAGAVALVVGVASLLPAWFAFALLAAAPLAVAVAAAIDPQPSLTILWRGRGQDRPAHRADWRWVILCKTGGLALFFAALIRISTSSWVGGEAGAGPRMPVTIALGMVVAWSAPAALALWSALWVHLWLRVAREDPARRDVPVVFVGGVALPHLRTQWALALARAGLRARFAPLEPVAGDVIVAVGAAAGAPRALAEDAFGDRAALRGLERRSEVGRRRLLVRGIQRLFKSASARAFGQGSGYWLGLQHWFVAGMWRDARESAAAASSAPWLTDIVGPPFSQLFPAPARRYYHAMMRALELDMIFIEDGVSFDRFRGVLRTLFEIYDVHGGRRRAEERFFCSHPGVHVVIHDHDFAARRSTGSFREPDYADFARARILHVFRARGGRDEAVPTPSGTRTRPLVTAS